MIPSFSISKHTYLTDLKHYFPDYVEKVVRAPQPTYSRTNSIGNGMNPSRPNG